MDFYDALRHHLVHGATIRRASWADPAKCWQPLNSHDAGISGVEIIADDWVVVPSEAPQKPAPQVMGVEGIDSFGPYGAAP